MPEKLPKSLVVILALLSVGSFLCAEYLEQYQFAWIERHPISTNLITGIVGFSTATLVVVIGFRSYADRAERYRSARRLHQAHMIALNIYSNTRPWMIRENLDRRQRYVVRREISRRVGLPKEEIEAVINTVRKGVTHRHSLEKAKRKRLKRGGRTVDL